MRKEYETLRRIDALQAPRHLFTIPAWAEPAVLERLIQTGHVRSLHLQHDENGNLAVAMGLELTPKGRRAIGPVQTLVVKGSLAGASLAAMSLIILYIG